VNTHEEEQTMSGDSTTGTPHVQPDPEAGLEAAARSGSRKPEGQGVEARPDTAPKDGSLEDEQREAARILKENTEKATGGGTDA